MGSPPPDGQELLLGWTDRAGSRRHEPVQSSSSVAAPRVSILEDDPAAVFNPIDAVLKALAFAIKSHDTPRDQTRGSCEDVAPCRGSVPARRKIPDAPFLRPS